MSSILDQSIFPNKSSSESIHSYHSSSKRLCISVLTSVIDWNGNVNGGIRPIKGNIVKIWIRPEFQDGRSIDILRFFHRISLHIRRIVPPLGIHISNLDTHRNQLLHITIIRDMGQITSSKLAILHRNIIMKHRLPMYTGSR